MTNDLIQHDQQAREQALDPSASFIVQAPAGSGKTELIIQRFLTLLGYVKKPEEILAITFTKKSAHEMRARVLKALEHAAHEPEPEKHHEKCTWQLATKVLKRNRELKWDLINNPNQLHIKTIDSFCTYLTGQLPLLSHFGSQPDIAGYSQYLYREAVLEVLSHVEENHPWSPAVARLLTHSDNDLNRLSKLLMKLLEKRDQWQRYLNLDMSDKDIRRQLSKQIGDVIIYTLESAAERFPDEHTDELLSLARFAADNVRNYDENSRILELKNMTSLPDDSVANMSAWQAIADIVLTKTHTWRKLANEEIGFPTLKDLKGEELKINKAMRARHKILIESLSEYEGLRSALENIRKLPIAGYTDAQWETLKALLEVLKITLAQLRVIFQLHGQIDFIENASGAALALGDETNPTDLALSLDYQIKHILVDEFQDTSFTQYHLLEMLTHGWMPNDGRSLFVVGDPMQSIYRFRQAEVGLFIRMQQSGIGDLRLTPLTLAVNFRSTMKIVDWNNQQFSAIFPDYSDIGSGAVHFSQSIANQMHGDHSHSGITLKGFFEGDEHQQASAVMLSIQETLALYPDEKIAILVRGRSHLSAIIPALKAAQLRFNALEIDPLISRQSIQDLLALTRALIHPADRIAWLSLLRAPWCGLTLSDLLLLCGQDRYDIIWERMNNTAVLATLSEDGQQRISSIMTPLKAAVDNRERSGFRQWVEQTWLAMGGPATLAEYNEITDTNEFFDLLEELSGHSQRINLETLNERMKKLHASTHYDDALIQIMTIHSAKGLEFDTVILPHLEKFNPNDEKSLLMWMEHPLNDDKISLLLAPIHATDSDTDPLYAYIETMQRVKSQFEVNRLFYVAATRAKKRLHLVFNVKDRDKTSNRGSFLDKLWPLIKNQVVLIENNEPALMAANKIGTVSRPITRFSKLWKNPVHVDLLTEQSSYQNKNGFQLPDHSPRLIGTVVHSIFQQISLSKITWWKDQSTNDRELYIQHHLNRAGFIHDKINCAVKSINDIISRAINDERGLWILKQHQDAQSEYSVTTTTENGCENLIIDRTFIDEHGTRWIIDYKTSESQDDDLAVFLKKQKVKYLDKMKQYGLAMSHIDARPVKMGLYFPALPAWCEW